MQIKKKRIWDNEEGEISLLQILVVIIILLLVWEFGAGYLGISPLSSYISESESSIPQNITLEGTVFNTVLGTSLFTNKTLHDVDPNPRNEDEDIFVYPMCKEGWLIGDHNYDVDNTDLIIRTNAPARSFLPYKITLELKRVDQWHSISYKVIMDQEITSGQGIKEFQISFKDSDFALNQGLLIWQYTIAKLTLKSSLGITIEQHEFGFFDENQVL